MVLLAAMILGLLSCFTRLWVRLPAFWPELLMFLSCVGCYSFGISLVGIALLAVGLVIRLFLAAAWVQRCFERPVAQTGSSYPAG
jgi:hypothetical protein